MKNNTALLKVSSFYIIQFQTSAVTEIKILDVRVISLRDLLLAVRPVESNEVFVTVYFSFSYGGDSVNYAFW